MKETKKQLLSSPHRPWADTSRLYDSVLFVQDKTKHESGYMRIVLIGRYDDKYEILGWPDDVSLFADTIKFGEHEMAQVRMDCYYPQGVFQYHGRGKFRVSEALSSMEIKFIPAVSQSTAK